jgi:outer membrane protein OmpA-like peptidoglycan-associated protein
LVSTALNHSAKNHNIINRSQLEKSEDSKFFASTSRSEETKVRDRMSRRVSQSAILFLTCALCAFAPRVCAQVAPATGRAASPDPPPKWDIFFGYSYLRPFQNVVQVPKPLGTSIDTNFDAVNLGGLFSGSYFFNRYLGVQVEFGEHEWGNTRYPDPIGTEGNDDGFLTIGAGPIVRFPMKYIVPFAHFVAGGAYVNGPYFNPNVWRSDLTVGGGLDIKAPWFNHHLNYRIIQADDEIMHMNYGPTVSEGVINLNALRLDTGLVLHLGPVAPPPSIALECTTSPRLNAVVFPGDPLTVTMQASGLNPKDNVIYSWSGTGVTGNGTTATVATNSLAPGQYTVTGSVKEGKPGKEGLKPWEAAVCSASFTVRAFEPPTISCTANPTVITPGGSSTITSVATSPQNRPLTYSYTATTGTITGNGPTAEYNSAGSPTGAVGITCDTTDDKGQLASSQTSVTIEPPVTPAPPQIQKLCSITFTTDKKRPRRVDNEAKACLDEVALDLKQQADAKVVIVGEETPDEKSKASESHDKVADFAAQRAVNAKNYLVTEQGIDASRITVVTSGAASRTVENYLVPSGADFNHDVPGTTAVDENFVKPEVRKPLPERHHAVKPQK